MNELIRGSAILTISMVAVILGIRAASTNFWWAAFGMIAFAGVLAAAGLGKRS